MADTSPTKKLVVTVTEDHADTARQKILRGRTISPRGTANFWNKITNNAGLLKSPSARLRSSNLKRAPAKRDEVRISPSSVGTRGVGGMPHNCSKLATVLVVPQRQPFCSGELQETDF
jgi:hypothetical protein